MCTHNVFQHSNPKSRFPPINSLFSCRLRSFSTTLRPFSTRLRPFSSRLRPFSTRLRPFRARLRLLSLHSLAGHAVDEGVAAGVHVPDAPRDAEHRQAKHDGEPEDDVEHGSVQIRVHWRQVELQTEHECAQDLGSINRMSMKTFEGFHA